MLGMKVHMFKLSSCISPRQYKIVFFPCYLCNMCCLLVISGKSGLPEPELSGTRIVGFYNFLVFFGYQFLKPEFQKTRKTQPEIFGLPERPPIQVINFAQGEEEGIDQAWDRFNGLIEQGPM